MQEKNSNNRSRRIMQYNLAGIILNLFLSAFKITIGTLTNSHAVIMDGVNSLSDMISLIISALTTFIGRSRRNDSHPFGYGRLEYVSTLVVTLIILYIGVTAIIHAVSTILQPHDPPRYTLVLILIMVVSMLCKLVYGFLMRREGHRLDCAAMIVTAADSMGDALTSAAILVGVLIYKATGFDIEHYLCIGVSLMVIRTGIEMFSESITKILGARIDPEIRSQVLEMAADMEEVLNVSNLMLHNYGEGIYIGSLDVEVDEKLTARQISKLSRRIVRKADELGVSITSVGISAANIQDPRASELLDRLYTIALAFPGIRRIQSFTVDFEEQMMSFYIVPNYTVRKYWVDTDSLIDRVRNTWPEMFLDIHIATDL
ncbi:MAG: cation transporter [Butyrivibrio sp.]|nr:cation transporter [Butyrivibrio sp.]